MKAAGSYQELSQSGVDLSAILPQSRSTNSLTALATEDEGEDANPLDNDSPADEVFEDPDAEDNDVADSYRELSVDKTPVLVNPSVRPIHSSSFSEKVRSGSLSEKVRGASVSEEVRAKPARKQSKAAGGASPSKSGGASPSKSAGDASPSKSEKKKPTGGLMSTEERGTGDVGRDIYWYYIRSGSLLMCFFYLMFLVAVQGFSLGANFYLTAWGSDSVNQQNEGHPLSSERNLEYMEVFAVLSLCGVLCTVVRGLFLAQIQLKASLKLHNSVLDRILAAPVAFFDVTPLGTMTCWKKIACNFIRSCFFRANHQPIFI